MRLVIAEKPSVAAALAAALGVKNKKDGYMEGGGYLISWCVGHLVELAEAAAYGEQYKKWSYDSLPILPQPWQYTVFKDRQKQFKILKDLMRRSDVFEVVNACDASQAVLRASASAASEILALAASAPPTSRRTI